MKPHLLLGRASGLGWIDLCVVIADYLKQRADELKQSASRIRDYRVFDCNYIPDQPLMRQEIKPIVDACLRYAQSGIPNHLFIFGSRGCGKTLTMRYLGRLLHEQHHLDVLYANCRQHNTSFKILAHAPAHPLVAR